MYLGKPVFMVPVSGQYEQKCNAIDATKAGAGITADHFDIGRFLKFIPAYKNGRKEFRDWLEKSQVILEKELTDF